MSASSEKKQRRKRRGREGEEERSRKRTGAKPMEVEDELADLQFEDPYGDDYETDSEEELEAWQEEQGDAEYFEGTVLGAGSSSGGQGGSSSSASAGLWLPGEEATGGAFEHDPGAYEMLHPMQMEWPCLSFDFVRDKLGHQRLNFPHTAYLVAGSQASNAQRNRVYIMKLSELNKTKEKTRKKKALDDDALDDDDDESSSEDDLDDVDDDPIVEHRVVKHNGGVNRIRSMPQRSSIVSTWSDQGQVYMWDFLTQLTSLEGHPNGELSGKKKPLQMFSHSDEGFAMDWSPISPAYFISGDCHSGISLWTPTPAGKWKVSKDAFKQHTDSVEDLQWSPREGFAFASCSVDKTIKIWDTRTSGKSVLSWAAHDTDVNVLSWNPLVSHLVASGGDEGMFKMWDLRLLRKDTTKGKHADSPKAFSEFKWHKRPISSICWHPHDASMLAVADGSHTSLWDLSVIADDKEDAQASRSAGVDIPPQLLFLHQGQQDVKEVRWHPQIPGLLATTAADSFHVFKTINSYHPPTKK